MECFASEKEMELREHKLAVRMLEIVIRRQSLIIKRLRDELAEHRRQIGEMED